MVSQAHMDEKTIRRTNARVKACLTVLRAKRGASEETKAKIHALFDHLRTRTQVDIVLP